MRPEAELIATLLHACCRAADDDRTGPLAAIAAASSPKQWLRALAVLDSHRLLPLCSHVLSDDLLARAPAQVATRLRAAFRETFVRNAIAMHEFAAVLSALESEGVEPVALKGAALVNTVYPQLGSRPMIDLDLLLPDGARDRAARVFERRGYRAIEEPDACNYVGPRGLRIDVVHRFRLFEGRPLTELVERTRPRFLARDRLALFEPNAMLVHLVFHMNGHRREVGHLLAWFVDVALLLRERGAEVDVARLARLVPSDEAWTWLLRTVRCVESSLDVAAPPALRPLLVDVSPLTLDDVLRSRRVFAAAPSLARAIRFLFARLFRRDDAGRGADLPDLSDFVAVRFDEARERRSPRASRPEPPSDGTRRAG